MEELIIPNEFGVGQGGERTAIKYNTLSLLLDAEAEMLSKIFLFCGSQGIISARFGIGSFILIRGSKEFNCSASGIARQIGQLRQKQC